MRAFPRLLRGLIVAAALAVAAASTPAHATQCGSANYPFPFTDVAGVADAVCNGILQSYVLGVTRGTSATTFSPNATVPRVQMTTFLARSIDQGLRRSNRKMALGQWWTPRSAVGLQRVPLTGGGPPIFCRSDGQWINVTAGDRIFMVEAARGARERELLPEPGMSVTALAGLLVVNGVVVAMDATNYRVFQSFFFTTATGGIRSLTEFSEFVRANSLAYDGANVWSANYADGTLSRFAWTPHPVYPWLSVRVGEPTSLPGFAGPVDLVYDGANLWVSEASANRIRKLDANGTPIQTVAVGSNPAYMAYDGANLWVPNSASNSITVVQASSGAIVGTIAPSAQNRLSGPLQAAFDGERILVTNSGNDSVTLFRAADMSLIANIALEPGDYPFGACSDGVNFWVVLRGSRELLRI